jgi:23S rRNA (cytidine1920-2'-O)/16S rRNA (cytidine1409-2'-O)-methyltransferase
LENTNVKDLPLLSIDDIPEIVVADLSFISLTFLIDALVKKYNHHYQCIFLIKPQFELSQKEVQNGLVKSKVLRRKAVDKIKNYSTTNGFIVDGIIESPIKGKKMGNTEYLICLHK